MDMWPSSDKGEVKGILQSFSKSFFKDKKLPKKTELRCFCWLMSCLCVCLGFSRGGGWGCQHRHDARTNLQLPWLTREHVKLTVLKEKSRQEPLGDNLPDFLLNVYTCMLILISVFLARSSVNYLLHLSAYWMSFEGINQWAHGVYWLTIISSYSVLWENEEKQIPLRMTCFLGAMRHT